MFKKRDIFQLFNAKKKYNGILINANICKIAKNKHQKHIAYYGSEVCCFFCVHFCNFWISFHFHEKFRENDFTKKFVKLISRKKILIPFSNCSICSVENEVRFRWSFRFSLSLICESSSADELWSEFPSEVASFKPSLPNSPKPGTGVLLLKDRWLSKKNGDIKW